MIATLRAANTSDITAAAILLYRGHLASPDGLLMGSATATSTPDWAAFADLLTAGLRLGRVDLAVSGDRINGVACWIAHPTPTHSPADLGPVGDLLFRLQLLDHIAPTPAHSPHQHLACLGTRPGYGARTITDLLLHHQDGLNDRCSHTVYTEVHEQWLRDWLLRDGYRDHGVSLGTDTDPSSHLVSRTGTKTLEPVIVR